MTEDLRELEGVQERAAELAAEQSNLQARIRSGFEEVAIVFI